MDTLDTSLAERLGLPVPTGNAARLETVTLATGPSPKPTSDGSRLRLSPEDVGPLTVDIAAYHLGFGC